MSNQLLLLMSVETPMMTSAGCIDLNSSFDTPMFRQAVSSASDRTNELNAALKQLGCCRRRLAGAGRCGISVKP
jgi:hypothetical protein